MQNTSELIKQLETLPAFSALMKGLEQNFKSGNFYVDHFLPESISKEKIDGVNLIYSRSDEAREEIAKENLLNDNGDFFDEFIHDDHIRNDVTELMRAIIKECRKCSAC
ncbi:MAG: hypothetical protein OSJ76_01205 [Alphaproteobacteria bacterium]|nr:hypothetical protein [Alphaproteobacteria bacterium]